MMVINTDPDLSKRRLRRLNRELVEVMRRMQYLWERIQELEDKKKDKGNKLLMNNLLGDYDRMEKKKNKLWEEILFIEGSMEDVE